MDKQNASSPGGVPRRDFLVKAATVAAAAAAAPLLRAPVYGQNQAPSANVAGANARIAVAYIGTGKQGLTHVRLQKADVQKNNIVQAAACDLYQKRLDDARKLIGLEEKDCYRDHRRLLERNDIDAVVISTVDNWHAQCSMTRWRPENTSFAKSP